MIGTRNPYYRSLGFSEVGMFLIDVGPSCVKFLALGPLQFAICPWHLAIAHCNWHLAIGPWPLAFAISNLTLTPCNLQRAMGTFATENLGFLIFVAFKSCGLVLGERKFA